MTRFHFNRLLLLPAFAGLVLLVFFIGINKYIGWKDLQEKMNTNPSWKTEILADTSRFTRKQLAFHDFESGNATDTASHLASTGYNSRQSLKLNSFVSFSPGLWIRFGELKPPAGSWIRVRAMVWLSGDPAPVKCNLVVTCNHNGINYKYMSVSLEDEILLPDQWNRVSIDYLIPDPSDQQDVLQVYLWYHGTESLLVDDIEIFLFSV